MESVSTVGYKRRCFGRNSAQFVNFKFFKFFIEYKIRETYITQS